QVRAHVGARPTPAGQPGLRLLGRSVGPGARALGGHRPSQREERRESLVGRGGSGLAVGWAATREVHHASVPVGLCSEGASMAPSETSARRSWLATLASAPARQPHRENVKRLPSLVTRIYARLDRLEWIIRLVVR